MRDEAQTRERIIEIATELIRQHGDVDKITIRDIAAKAGVGVGLINYHFQTKENLLNQCIQRIIGRIIGGFDALYQSLEDMTPVDKLKFLLRENAKFLCSHPGLSRASITHDMLSPKQDDNSMQTINAYRPVIKEICGDRLSQCEQDILLHIIISSLQVMFLRKDITKEALGINFEDEKERNALTDMIVERLLGNLV